MKAFWSRIARELSPYVPGEQPRIANLVKLNTNESPFGPSPLALEAMRAAAADTLRLYPDPESMELREALAAHHGVRPEQVFVGNGSDEVLAHAFVALLKQPKPLLFPDVTYSFYPVWAQLFGLACETVPLDDEMRVRVEDYRREAGSIVIANPNAPTGVALPRAEIARLLEDHPGYRDDLRAVARGNRPTARRSSRYPGGDRRGLCRFRWRERGSTHRRSSEPAGRADDVEVARSGRVARGLRARRRGADRGAPPREKQLQFLPARLPRPGGRDGFGSRRRLLPRELREGRRRTRSADAGADPAWLCRSAFEREFRLRQASGAGRAGIRRGGAYPQA